MTQTEAIAKLYELVSKLADNQKKIFDKIQELDLMTKGDNVLLGKVRKDLSGLSTALIGAELLTKEGLDLHQSFDIEKPEEIKSEESV